jgi:hypothetical protein
VSGLARQLAREARQGQTPLPRAVLAFGGFLAAARRDLDEREYEALLSVLAARVAREYRLRLDEQERAA